ncbi:histidinol-phosphate aminotransferase family protein [Alteromonas aestuariivivens]|uniref:histidinol-phosphate transaminase n=1 Tax=Alteromonas aestuariivivens TaxID=1938339 RepID=A0A3D8MBQ4_9ALTE|nr:histidinol-phosphate transaminase [Alteromonas aestuariivivens]RDV27456.1 histidinol-phosphate aminotransferase family protein [Alteromonas aestuariivivens]
MKNNNIQNLPSVDTSRRNWLKTVGLGAGAVALTGCFDSGVKELQAAGMKTEHFPTATPNLNDGLIRLSSNENAFGPSAKAVEAMQGELFNLNRYADATVNVLVKKIAEQEGVSEEQIVVTNGSSPILFGYADWITKNGNKLVTSMATYEGIPRGAEFMGADVTYVPLDANMDFDLDAIEAAVTEDTTAVYICNPNNPTGRALDPVKLTEFAKRVSQKAQVFIDEAYIEMSDAYPANVQSKLAAEGYNVVICRTFSKIHAMAGQRLGYAIMPAEQAKQMGRMLRMGGVNYLGLVAGMASMDDHNNLNVMRERIKTERLKLTSTADALGRPYAKNPQGNFIYMDTGMPHAEFAEKMKALGIKVVGRTWPGYDTWSRISIGTPEENDACVSALKAVYA